MKSNSILYMLIFSTGFFASKLRYTSQCEETKDFYGLLALVYLA